MGMGSVMGGASKAVRNGTANISPTASAQPSANGMGGKGGGAPMPQRPQVPMGRMNGMPGMFPQRPPMGGMNPKGGGMPMPTQQPVSGMGGKGGQIPSQYGGFGQMPPQVKPGMGGKGGGMPGGTLVGFGPTDMPIYSNDPNAVPYTGPSMGGYFVNGVPGQRPVQQPVSGMGGKGFNAPISQMPTQQQLQQAQQPNPYLGLAGLVGLGGATQMPGQQTQSPYMTQNITGPGQMMGVNTPQQIAAFNAMNPQQRQAAVG